MGSLFDSKVYERRNATPWARMNLEAFLRDAALNLDNQPATLTVHHRPDVATRLWWTLEFRGEDGETYRAEASSLQLCLWRAAEYEMRARRKDAAE